MIRTYTIFLCGLLVIVNAIAFADNRQTLFNLNASEADVAFLPEVRPHNIAPVEVRDVNEPFLLPEIEVESEIYVSTAADPRFGKFSDPHREIFVPASELVPPEKAISIPIKDTRPEGFFDMNEWEEERIYSSSLFTDTSIYASHVTGDGHLSFVDKDFFYESNFRYELFSTNPDGNSISVNLDTTHTNDRRSFYNDNFTLNQFTVDSKTANSGFSLGHSYPQMSRYTMTQSLLGLYGYRDLDDTRLSAFGGYYALDRNDLRNPRYTGGLRIGHQLNDMVKTGVTLVVTEDHRDNAASDNVLPQLSNKVMSFDTRIEPGRYIFVESEVARSITDFDKRQSIGRQKGGAYKLVGGYERERFLFEAGVEKADTSFLSVLGSTPRDERSYHAGVFYELNRYFQARFRQRTSRDNIDSYQRSTIVRQQPELEVFVSPSDYYSDMRLSLRYIPIHEYSENSDLMDRHQEIVWLDFTQKAGDMGYYAAIGQTIDRDEIEVLNDRDINKLQFELTWDYNKFKRVYSRFGRETIDYRRAGGKDYTTFYGFGGSSRFQKSIFIDLNYLREEVRPDNSALDSSHDRVHLTLTREYSHQTSLVLGFEASSNSFKNSDLNFDDYTARLRLIRNF